MARIDPDRQLVASILDRLIDEDPEARQEPNAGRRPLLRDLRLAVRRDLENLLNTRRTMLLLADELDEVERSIFAYGVPDLTGANLSSKTARAQFLKQVESVIRRYEPRFKTVKVIHTESEDPLDRTLRFRIEALLWAEPAPELVTFDSELEPVRRTFEVQGAG